MLLTLEVQKIISHVALTLTFSEIIKFKLFDHEGDVKVLGVTTPMVSIAGKHQNL